MSSEFLTVVDGNDTVLGYSSKEDVQRRGLNYRCVQVFLFNSEDKLLVGKRPDTKKKYPSQYAAIMGHVRRGETYEEAAHREVREEVGVNTKLKRITKFSVMDGPSRVFQEIYAGGVSEAIQPDKTEIIEVKFIHIKDLKVAIVTDPSRYALPFSEAVRAYMKIMNTF